MGISSAHPAPLQPAARVVRFLGRAAGRLRGAHPPFRIGDVVTGDDPFNGRRTGTVTVIRAPFVGLRIPGTPAGTLVYFDHRDVEALR
ncbi:hypothetical protein ACTWLI_04640 [Arthrobacter sp. Hor0625]|uniref:hypothetical protein n=1 Tax=Arthrobacter sp. Hor0625 TaxID=3457358 RepID=UPI00403EF2E0